jgi:phosphoribosylformimino-5-aminoimidazole carboxamide ribotide isomerase
MEIVPVIDLKGGAVVRAKHGDRPSYRPIETPLSATSDALDVVAGLLSLHLFRTLYVADLDAIEASGDGGPILDRVAEKFPELALWVDNGCSDRRMAERFLAKRPHASLVLGSESQRDTGLVRALRRHPRTILSLDFRGNRFLGPERLLAEPDNWPDRVILMTLARVGSGAGPDLDRFDEIRRRAGSRSIYLAGGLRDGGDLAAVKACGAAGILVASALHDGRLSAAEIREFAQPDGRTALV